jgi:excisionase family DNA binding protein
MSSDSILKSEVAEIAMKAAAGVLAMHLLADKKENILSTDEVCDLTGYSKKTIYLLIQKREIPFHKVAGRRRLFFYKSEIIAWIGKKEVTHDNG